jgi:hypothetical protein
MYGLITSKRIETAANAEIARMETLEFKNSFATGRLNQWRSEMALLSQNNYCPMIKNGKMGKSITTQLEDIKPDKLKKLLTDDFYDPSVMEAAICEASSIYLDKEGLAVNERLREWISGLKQIGDESGTGYAMLADFGEESLVSKAVGAFVIKVPRSVVDSDELIHETFIAIKALNGMRKILPNFAEIFGMFRCSPPFIDPISKQVVGWCDSLSKRAVTYSIYENVSPNTSFGKVIEQGVTPFKFMKLYMQFLLSLRPAFIKYRFTHYDAHDENLLRKKSSKGDISIPYESPDGPIYLQDEDGDIVTFIDYGMSHIALNVTTPDGKTELVHYGHIGRSAPLNNYSIYRDRGHPMHDCYKLLAYCLKSMYNKNKPTYELIAPLFQFFNKEEDFTEIMTKQLKNYFHLPWEMVSSADPNEDPERAYNDSLNMLDAFIRTCRQFMIDNLKMNDPFLKEVPPGSTLLTCGNICLTPLDALELTGVQFQHMGIPRTFYEFYDIYHHLNKRPSDQDVVVRNFLVNDEDGTNSVFHHAADREEARLTALANMVLGLDLNGNPSVNGQIPPFIKLPRPYTNLRNYKSLESCKVILSLVAQWLDSYQRLLRGTNIMKQITDLLYTFFTRNPTQVNKIDREVIARLYERCDYLFGVLHVRRSAFEAYALNIREEIAYINPPVITKEYVRFFEEVNGQHPDVGNVSFMKWYTDTIPSMESLIEEIPIV